ncbi:MAG: SDR family oxidoreductase [Caulobacteraceae bacterium]
MRILISGSSGLIGAAVAARLAALGEIATLGRRQTCSLVADLADPAAVAGLDLSGFDALIHCAGVVDEDFAANPELAFRQATLGAAALVDRAVAGGVRRLAYISSAHVYGPLVGVIDEQTAPNPLSNYAIAHYATEQIFRRAADRMAAVALLRPCAVFGVPPDMAGFRRWGLAPFAFPRRAVLDHRIALTGAGDQRRNFVGASDVAEVVASWMETGDGFTIVNPVGVSSMSVWDFTRLCGREAELITGLTCAVSREEDSGRTPGDDFDYRSRSPLRQGVADLATHLRQFMQLILENDRSPPTNRGAAPAIGPRGSAPTTAADR